jgi:excisionase family DNA binding protein
MQELYTIRDVANHFGTCTRTIKRWLKDGVLQGSKLGGRVYFSTADITNALERHRTTGKGERNA